MFHRSRFGEAGEELPGDLNGNVPEEGDDWLDFAWPAGEARRFSESPQQWKTFVSRAVEQTKALTAGKEG